MIRFLIKLLFFFSFLTGVHAASWSKSMLKYNLYENSTFSADFLLNNGGGDNIPYKSKSTQFKITPSTGSYLGGCCEDGYYVKISGESFGNGWDITSVTICGVEVCQIVMQSSDIVIVYPGAGTPGTGDIVITSKSKGKTIIEKAFTYQCSATYDQSKAIKYSNIDKN